jgi:hypothetical protein
VTLALHIVPKRRALATRTLTLPRPYLVLALAAVSAVLTHSSVPTSTSLLFPRSVHGRRLVHKELIRVCRRCGTTGLRVSGTVVVGTGMFKYKDTITLLVCTSQPCGAVAKIEVLATSLLSLPVFRFVPLFTALRFSTPPGRIRTGKPVEERMALGLPPATTRREDLRPSHSAWSPQGMCACLRCPPRHVARSARREALDLNDARCMGMHTRHRSHRGPSASYGTV